MSRTLAISAIALLSAMTACKRGGNPGASPSLESPPVLAWYAAQPLVLTPTTRVRAADTLALVRAAGSGQAVGRQMDDAIAARLRELDLGGRWILPDALQRAYERNRMYVSDPYQLAVDPIRSSDFAAGKKYGEPLSSQLRTMIALHEDARYVLVPIELRLESGRASLRAAVLDPRTAEARWVGSIESDSAAAGTARSLTQIAERLVNLFFAP